MLNSNSFVWKILEAFFCLALNLLPFVRCCRFFLHSKDFHKKINKQNKCVSSNNGIKGFKMSKKDQILSNIFYASKFKLFTLNRFPDTV